MEGIIRRIDIALNISTVIVEQDINIYRNIVLLETRPLLHTMAGLVKTEKS